MQVNGCNVIMLVATRVKNSFIMLKCMKRLEVAVKSIALPVKINFGHESCQMVEVARNVRFKIK